MNLAEHLTRAVMHHYGYTDDDILAAEQEHPGRVCTEDCETEDGIGRHPIKDELDRTASIMVEVVIPTLAEWLDSDEIAENRAADAVRDDRPGGCLHGPGQPTTRPDLCPNCGTITRR